MFKLYSYTSDVLDFSKLEDPSETWALGETIGEGTYGAVYMGTHKATGEQVAIKVMENVSEVIEEIEEEYLVLRDLGDHANMPRFHGIYLRRNPHHEDQVWIVMELCGAGSVTELARHLLNQEQRMEPDLIAHIMKETLKVLDHLHYHQVIHRDVKGHNILITGQGQIKMVDFGVSGHLDFPNGRMKTHVGTPYWMAPEVIACEQQLEYSYDVRCDVWSLGITAIELADGKPPLGDLDPRRVLFKIPRSPAPTLRHTDQWPAELNDFIAQCLVKDFEQRPDVPDLLKHPFIQKVPEDTSQLRKRLVSLTANMERKISEPEVTTKHGQLKPNRKSRREGPPTADNLTQLEVLDEETIVQQLELRYSADEIYTYIGDILLAVNPFVSLPIYTDEYIRRYMHAVKADNPPHIYAVADQAYQMMMHNKKHQCIVISGESGAGKTESANLLVQQLTQLGKAPNRTLEEKILQVNPLMEAFGNAKTVINDNSSRFGKYLEMFFTASSGTVIGAKITEYLLEKSRVINQAPGEQNFHIFYYVHDGLMSSDRQEEYHLKPRTLYKYIAEYTEKATDVSAVSINRVKFRAIEHCFDIIGFRHEDVTSVYAILAAILHTGNIEFVPKDSGYGGEASAVSNTDLITTVSQLLGLDFTDLLECLTTTGMVAKGEVIVRDNSIREACDSRDAMAKALYGRLFSWIVNRISSLLKPGRSQISDDECYVSGLLDIFGFENFKTNSFEQLCINIANEQIQYYFNQHIFAWELEEYKNEGIDAAEVNYVDNRPILDMFLSKPVGLLALLDEESHFPQSTDLTLVEKFQQNIKSPHYCKTKSSNVNFAIDHFAGKVEYDARGLLEKNRDRLPIEILNIMRLSENEVVKALFQTPLTKTGNLASGSLTSSSRSSRVGSPMSTSSSAINISSYNSKSTSSMGGSRIYSLLHTSSSTASSASMTRIQQTVATYFRFSLMDLLNKMVAGTPHFVRCLKPNDVKEPGNFQPARVTTQLRYTGVLETTRIRRQGYSHRIVFSEFLKRYHVLGFRHDEAVSVTGESCQILLERLGMSKWAIGKSKVFLKYYHVEELAQKYEEVCQKIVRVQAYIRMWLARSRFYQLRWKRDKAALMIQRHMRGFVVRRKFTAMNRKRHDAATTIQKMARGQQTRKKYQPILAQRREASVKIQSQVRRFLCRRRYSKMRLVREEEERVRQRQAEEESAQRIQRIFRMYRLKKKTNAIVEEHKTRELSATKIQAFFRMWRQKVVYRKLQRQKKLSQQKAAAQSQQAVSSNENMLERQDSSSKAVRTATSALASAVKDSPSRKKTSATDSPSKKVWERVSLQAVGEARIEQMKKMNDVKAIMPDRDALYYDSVSGDEMMVTGNNPPEVVLNGADIDTDYPDIDEEVMSFMHTHIHNSQKMESKTSKPGPEAENDNENVAPPTEPQQAPSSDSMSGVSWDAPLLTAKENALAPDDYNENISGRISRHSEYSIEADLQTERDDLAEEDNAAELAKRLEEELTGSILALWQQRLTQSSSFEGDIEIEYASESETGSAGPPSPTPESSRPTVFPATRTSYAYTTTDNADRMLRRDRNGNSMGPGSSNSNPNAPVRLPISASADSNSALEEIRARLRKTKFDYSSDSRQRISDATPQTDYRAVLKKKGKV
ncbi:myosin-IIIb [Aplysia californica]|uniref:non-specific serine/threonine protein kinase n=1 Tax=Aplysia californica TaxID=6500 RepID=A0ABM1A1H2_APLCA|nr:myosin-IIIb [Aplysia californica]